MHQNVISPKLSVSVGILPILQPGGHISLNAHTQTLNLIANIFSYLSTNKYYKLNSIAVFVCNYKLADRILQIFDISGLGTYIIHCSVKKMGPNLYTSADLKMIKLPNIQIQSKL